MAKTTSRRVPAKRPGTDRSTAADIPSRPFGRYAESVSALALGGYHLGSIGNQREAIRIVHAAVDAGITFMDNAWEYHEGESEEIMGKALVGRRDEVFLMTKVCTHGRERKVAMRQLTQSLRLLKTDHLDLWQVHECVYPNDPERHFASGVVFLFGSVSLIFSRFCFRCSSAQGWYGIFPSAGSTTKPLPAGTPVFAP